MTGQGSPTAVRRSIRRVGRRMGAGLCYLIRPSVERFAILASVVCVIVQKWSLWHKNERSCYYGWTDAFRRPATRLGCPRGRTPVPWRADPPGDLVARAENRCPRRAGRINHRALGRRTPNEQERLVRPLPFQTGLGVGDPGNGRGSVCRCGLTASPGQPCRHRATVELVRFVVATYRTARFCRGL